MQYFEEENLTTLATQTVQEGNLLRRKAIKGVFFLGFRRILTQLIITGANIILARLLFPEVFGAFAIAMGLVSFMSIFSSLGLESALIQRKGDSSKEELQSVFTITLLLSCFVFLVAFFLAPYFFRFYQDQLGDQGVLILQLLSVAIPLQALKGISGVLLERKLDYFRLMIGDGWEIFVLEAATILLAGMGFGVMSFVWGYLLARLLGFVGFFLLAPWPIRLHLSLNKIRGILGFGANFQMTTIIGGLNFAVVPIFVGKVAGASGLGLLNWAGGLAAFPRGIPEVFGRLAFPVCARSQDDKKLLRTVIEKSIQLSCFAAFPLITIMMALAFPITSIVYTDKWAGGIPAFYFFSFQSIFLVVGGVFTQALLALGEAKIVRNISLFWAVLQWVLTVPLVLKFGFTGMAMASVLVSSTIFIPLIWLRKRVKFEVFYHVWPYLLFSLLSGSLAFILNKEYTINNIASLILAISLSIVFYLLLVFFFKKDELIQDVVKIKTVLSEA
ncbi:MAG: oligosaccharide flippase family protein [bacterium]|nr:oligosaccharide flippase family protein [bacterium]